MDDDKNCVKVEWEIEGARKISEKLDHGVVSQRKVFLECLQETAWLLRIEIDVRNENWCVYLTRSCVDRGPKLVIVEYDIRLIGLQSYGMRDKGARGRADFKPGTRSGPVWLIHNNLLRGYEDEHIFGNNLKLSIRLWPIQFLLPSPTTLSLLSKEGDWDEDTSSALSRISSKQTRDDSVLVEDDGPSKLDQCLGPNAFSSETSTSLESREIGDGDLETQQPPEVGAVNRSLSLARDLLSLLDKRTFSDFELRCGGQSYPVHKAVISARSPVFHALLTSHMLEASENATDIPDFPPETVQQFVQFLYSGSVSDLDASSALSLYSLADKYAVTELKDLCSDVLVSSLCARIVAPVVILSDRHSDTDLKEKVMSYVRKHEIEVLRSPEWVAFMREEPLLALEVYHDLHLKKHTS